jgi:hypothetical protein
MGRRQGLMPLQEDTQAASVELAASMDAAGKVEGLDPLISGAADEGARPWCAEPRRRSLWQRDRSVAFFVGRRA